MNSFDVVVVGGGHAGIEAASICSKMGCSVALVTMQKEAIGRLSCNPSIGGSAKGHLVKEIDALGGAMGYLADLSGIQFKLLNKSKGPAVWSPRAQNDNRLHPFFSHALISSYQNLTIIEDTIRSLVLEDSRIRGVELSTDILLTAKCVILCAGTFLNGIMYTGKTAIEGGRVGEKSAKSLSEQLQSFGMQSGRLKTGTPPRIRKSSIQLPLCSSHNGDEFPHPFSFRTRRVKNSVPCWETQTNERTHEILRDGFKDSPMFTGLINGAGPRYCPSIEDKICRFHDKVSHSIVIEPESLSSDIMYVNGFSTSLSPEIQEFGLKSIQGLGECEIVRYGYAVEYDFFFPYQLHHTLETKAIGGLFFAGQINGTSGYEEAASQGLMAGINAACQVLERDRVVLSRSEAYIGVLIDDLVNKSTTEPYRIFTSLAEFRLLLRQDNAEERLSRYGHELGTLTEKQWNQLNNRLQLKSNFVSAFRTTRVETKSIPFEKPDGTKISHKGSDLISAEQLIQLGSLSLYQIFDHTFPDEDYGFYQYEIENASIEVKYAGYIEKQKKEVASQLSNELKPIPPYIDYSKIHSLSSEARSKLSLVRPSTLAQASRITGVSPSDISILSIYIK